MKSIASIIPELADGYRQRYMARHLACEVCGRLATRGQLADLADGTWDELPLCDDCDVEDVPGAERA